MSCAGEAFAPDVAERRFQNFDGRPLHKALGGVVDTKVNRGGAVRGSDILHVPSVTDCRDFHMGAGFWAAPPTPSTAQDYRS